MGIERGDGVNSGDEVRGASIGRAAMRTPTLPFAAVGFEDEDARVSTDDTVERKAVTAAMVERVRAERSAEVSGLAASGSSHSQARIESWIRFEQEAHDYYLDRFRTLQVTQVDSFEDELAFGEGLRKGHRFLAYYGAPKNFLDFVDVAQVELIMRNAWNAYESELLKAAESATASALNAFTSAENLLSSDEMRGVGRHVFRFLENDLRERGVSYPLAKMKNIVLYAIKRAQELSESVGEDDFVVDRLEARGPDSSAFDMSDSKKNESNWRTFALVGLGSFFLGAAVASYLKGDVVEQSTDNGDSNVEVTMATPEFDGEVMFSDASYYSYSMADDDLTEAPELLDGEFIPTVTYQILSSLNGGSSLDPAVNLQTIAERAGFRGRFSGEGISAYTEDLVRHLGLAGDELSDFLNVMYSVEDDLGPGPEELVQQYYDSDLTDAERIYIVMRLARINSGRPYGEITIQRLADSYDGGKSFLDTAYVENLILDTDLNCRPILCEVREDVERVQIPLVSPEEIEMHEVEYDDDGSEVFVLDDEDLVPVVDEIPAAVVGRHDIKVREVDEKTSQPEPKGLWSRVKSWFGR